jgi:DNA-binding NtrC family response regulator
MSGTVFLDRVGAMYPDTFRIVLSGRTNLEEMMAAVNSGVIDRFYAKPWHPETLRNNVRQAFRHPRLAAVATEPALA